MAHVTSDLQVAVLAKFSRQWQGVLRAWSPPDNFAFPSAIGNMIVFTPILGQSPLSYWISLRGFLMRPSFRTPQRTRPKCLLSKFLPRTRRIRGIFPGKTFVPNWWSLELSFVEIGWYSTIEPNGITGPQKGSPSRHSWGGFPSDKRSWTFRR